MVWEIFFLTNLGQRSDRMGFEDFPTHGLDLYMDLYFRSLVSENTFPRKKNKKTGPVILQNDSGSNF